MPESSPPTSASAGTAGAFGGRLRRVPALGVIGLIRVYQLFLSPLKAALLGPQAACRFHPSCSQYAREAVARHGAAAGTALALWRVAKCHPFHEAGEDPVPERLSAPWRRLSAGPSRAAFPQARR